MHRPYIISSKSPIPPRVKVAEFQPGTVTLRPHGSSSSNLAGHHFRATARGLVIKENSTDNKQPASPIHLNQSVRRHFGHAIWGRRLEWHFFVAGAIHVSKHFGAGGLINTGVWLCRVNNFQ